MYVLNCNDTLDIPSGVAMILITTEFFDLLLRDILHACYNCIDKSFLVISLYFVVKIKIVFGCIL